MGGAALSLFVPQRIDLTDLSHLKPVDLQCYLFRDRWKNVIYPKLAVTKRYSRSTTAVRNHPRPSILWYAPVLLAIALKDTRSYFSELVP